MCLGTFGAVSLVEDVATHETYALKQIRTSEADSSSIARERSILAALDSPFCVRFFAEFVCKSQQSVFFLNEAVLGGELFRVLSGQRRFREEQARFYGACVVCAFAHIHAKNVIFRDLKPENLLIGANGFLKLVDFSSAKRRDSSCSLSGNAQYYSPEVITCEAQSFQTDWWTLGVFVYEMVIGRAPFRDDARVNMYEKILTQNVNFPIKPKMSRWGKDLITALLHKQPYKRLGAGLKGANDVKAHQWFADVDWQAMREQRAKAPFVPRIAHNKDLSNFDDFDEF